MITAWTVAVVWFAIAAMSSVIWIAARLPDSSSHSGRTKATPHQCHCSAVTLQASPRSRREQLGSLTTTTSAHRDRRHALVLGTVGVKKAASDQNRFR